MWRSIAAIAEISPLHSARFAARYSQLHSAHSLAISPLHSRGDLATPFRTFRWRSRNSIPHVCWPSRRSIPWRSRNSIPHVSLATWRLHSARLLATSPAPVPHVCWRPRHSIPHVLLGTLPLHSAGSDGDLATPFRRFDGDLATPFRTSDRDLATRLSCPCAGKNTSP